MTSRTYRYAAMRARQRTEHRLYPGGLNYWVIKLLNYDNKIKFGGSDGVAEHFKMNVM